MNKELDKLRELLVGSDILAVEPPDQGVYEAICKITALKEGRRHTFHLHATDMGFWIGRHLTQTSEQTPRYTNLHQLLDDVAEHASAFIHKACEDAGWPPETDPFWETDPGPVIKPAADPKEMTLGFKCHSTGKEWRASMAAVKEHELQFGVSLSKPEDRERAAKLLSEGVMPVKGLMNA